MKLSLLAFSVVPMLLISGCCKTCPPVEPDIVYVPPLDAGFDGPNETIEEAPTPCARACVVMRNFHCPEGGVTPSGSRCYDICRSAGNLMNPQCIADAKTLDALHACHVRCQ